MYWMMGEGRLAWFYVTENKIINNNKIIINEDKT